MATIRRTGTSSSLAEVVERILDKGIVIDAWINVSLVGIDLLTVEARIVVASVDTYLRYADAIGLTAQPAGKGGMPALTAPVHQDALTEEMVANDGPGDSLSPVAFAGTEDAEDATDAAEAKNTSQP